MNRLLFLLLLIPGSLLLSCNASKKMTQYDASSVIRMSKGPCFGSCPVYDITIDGSGNATFEGKRFVDKMGSFGKTFSREETSVLFKHFEEAGFWDFKDLYTDEITDLPTTFITFEHQGRSKKIQAYYNIPEKLQELIAEVHALAESEGWTALTEK